MVNPAPSRATGFTPFFLVHGAEAVLPTDLEYGWPRVRGYDEGANQRAREDSLDQLDEARTVALMHSARYQMLWPSRRPTRRGRRPRGRRSPWCLRRPSRRSSSAVGFVLVVRVFIFVINNLGLLGE
jgi:hypothetical protein